MLCKLCVEFNQCRGNTRKRCRLLSGPWFCRRTGDKFWAFFKLLEIKRTSIGGGDIRLAGWGRSCPRGVITNWTKRSDRKVQGGRKRSCNDGEITASGGQAIPCIMCRGASTCKLTPAPFLLPDLFWIVFHYPPRKKGAVARSQKRPLSSYCFRAKFKIWWKRYWVSLTLEERSLQLNVALFIRRVYRLTWGPDLSLAAFFSTTSKRVSLINRDNRQRRRVGSKTLHFPSSFRADRGVNPCTADKR